MKPIALLLLVTSLALVACEKQAGFSSPDLEEYLPLQPGKFIRYRLDSMVFVHFGQRDSLISYDAKDVVEEAFTDSQGRQTFRVVRYLRDTASTAESDYRPNMVYFVTPTRESVELVEQTLRYVKMRLPVTEGFQWRGNSFLPYAPFYVLYEFSNDEDMGQWSYTYQQVGQPMTINGIHFDETATVMQVADSSNVPIQFPEGLAYRNHWEERYARGVGLIYREVFMWEYQPPNAGSPGYRTGFGLRLSILDYN